MKGRVISTFVHNRLQQFLTMCIGVGCGIIFVLVLIGVYLSVNLQS